MVRVFVIGDPHFKVSNADETEEAVLKVLPIIREAKPDLIVCLGDTLDRHASINVYPLTRAVDFLRSLREIAPLVLIIGNHDRPNNSDFLSEFHPFTALRDWPDTLVADRVISKEIQGQKFVFVPYVPNGRFREALQTLPGSNVNVTAIFAHQEIRGVPLGTIESREGDVWGPDEPLIITGHIHDYCELADNVIYVGALMQQSHGEKYNKTVSIFDFDQNGGFTHKRINLELREKITERILCCNILRYVPPENKQIRLILIGTPAEIRDLMKSSIIDDLKKKGIKIVSEVRETESVSLIIENDHSSYRKRLQEAAIRDPDMYKLYLELFGNQLN